MPTRQPGIGGVPLLAGIIGATPINALWRSRQNGPFAGSDTGDGLILQNPIHNLPCTSLSLTDDQSCLGGDIEGIRHVFSPQVLGTAC
jgi:hypothetical protein